MTARSVAFVIAYGETREGFFPDTLLAHLGAVARAHGHRAVMLRVYFDGRDPERDAEVSRRVTHWLDARSIDTVVIDRVVHPETLRGDQRTVVYVTRGDSFDPVDEIDWVLGAVPGMTRRGATRRAPSHHDLAAAFTDLLAALRDGHDPGSVPGVSRMLDGTLVQGPPLPRAAPQGPFDALTTQDVICLGDPPRRVHRTLFGNVGCPFADDPRKLPLYAGLSLPEGPSVARLGCAFCDLGGDYEKRPDPEVIAETVEQAVFWSTHDPETEGFVLSDQHPLRYLPAVLRAAHRAGVRPLRWLFAARVDTFVRERPHIDEAIAAARETGHRLALYLSGFEAFSDVELTRYNKGVTVHEQLAAVDAMRALARAHPGVFDYARERGHSLILWNPWTTPEDLAQSLTTMRARGLGELFHDPGRNRLRLYEDLPVYYAAARDGALRETWEAGDSGSGARKGYNPERPWRFLDPRTRRAYDFAQVLRAALGPDTELAQLTAAARYALHPGASIEALHAGLDTLRESLEALLRTRRPGDPPRGRSRRGTAVHFAGPCNNHCAGCAQGDVWRPDDTAALEARVDVARATMAPVILMGREPTLHPAFASLVARALGNDARPVGVVTNARRFAYRAFAQGARDAGLRAASVKLFAADPDTADALTAAPGSFAQGLAGIRTLRALGLTAIELRACAYTANLEGLPRLADLARRLETPRVRVEVALDAVGLEHLERAAQAIRDLARRCAALGVSLDAHPLGASTGNDLWLPEVTDSVSL